MSSALFLEGGCPEISRAMLRRLHGQIEASETTSFSHSIDGILGHAKSTPASPITSSSTDHPRVPSEIITVRTPPAVGSSKRGPASNRRRARTNYTTEQLGGLEALFADNMYPGIDERDALADAVDLPEARIQVWFQNRRARLHRKQQGPFSGASYPGSTSPKVSKSTLRPTKDTKRGRPSTSSSPESSLNSLSPPLPPASQVSIIPVSSSPLQYLQVCAQACCTPTSPHTHLKQSGAQCLTSSLTSYYPWATLDAFQSGYHPYSYIYPGTSPFFYDYSLPLSASVPVASVREMPSELDSSTPDEAPSSVRA